jgi:hypothetical protein
MVLYAVLKLGNHRFRIYINPKTTEEDPTIVSIVQHELKVKFVAHLYPDNFSPDPISFFEKVFDSTTNRDFAMKYKFLSDDGDKSTNYTSNHDQLHLTFSNTHKIEFQLSNYDNEKEEMMEKMIQMHKMPYQSIDKNHNQERLNKLIATVEELKLVVAQQEKDNEHLKEEVKKHKKDIESLEKKLKSNAQFFNTTILSEDEISKLKEWTGYSNWKRIYKASVDGFGANDFHRTCDNRGETLSIIQTENGCIFGGYNPVSWTSQGSYQFDNRTYIFSLKNTTSHNPVRFLNNGPHHSNSYSTFNDSSYGPTFGGGHDFYISDKANQNNSSYTNLGHSFSVAGYSYGTNQIKNYLCGSYNFKVKDIEVFNK